MSSSVALPTTSNLVQAFWTRLVGWLIAEVPAELGHCEFVCRKPSCSRGESQACEQRLQYMEGLAALSLPVTVPGSAIRVAIRDVHHSGVSHRHASARPGSSRGRRGKSASGRSERSRAPASA